MNIQKAGAASGLSPDTIRFYEREAVLPRPPRRENGYREYTGEHVATLRLVRGLRHVGMSLADMAAVAHVAHDGTCGDLRERLIGTLAETLEETDVRMRELRHARTDLKQIMSSLSAMRANDERVPGATPCSCVQLMDDVQ